jgi:hypothetical protein
MTEVRAQPESTAPHSLSDRCRYTDTHPTLLQASTGMDTFTEMHRWARTQACPTITHAIDWAVKVFQTLS